MSTHETRRVAGATPWSAGRIARIVVMLAVALFFILPIVGFIAMAFRSQEGIESGADGFLGLGGMSLENVIYSWGQLLGFGPAGGGVFVRWILNSLIVSVVGGVLALVAALPAG
jgi:multiple sugar transport system permease protein